MEGSSGDQWTQPRGALHSLGYYVVSPPLRSNTMPAATYYARRYYTGRPSVPRASPSSPRSVPLFFCRAARRLRTFPSRILALYSRNFALALSLSLYLSLSLPFAPFVGATRAPTASRANFDPPMATRRRLPRAGKLISPRIHAPSRLSPSSCTSLPPLPSPAPSSWIRGRRVSDTHPEVVDGRAGVVPRLEMRIQSQVYSPVAGG